MSSFLPVGEQQEQELDNVRHQLTGDELINNGLMLIISH